MAQIIKYQKGGYTSNKRYGTFTIDGNKFEVDDNFLNQLTNYGKSLDDETAYQFSKITDALRNGENLSYDSNADRLDGNVQFDVTNSQNNRLGNRRSRIGRFFGNSWRGKENASRNAINALKGFTYTTPTPGNSIYDWSNTINVEYKRDKDGNYELVNGNKVFIQGANNLQVIRRLQALKDIASYTDKDTFKGYGNLDKQAYIDLYNRLGDEGIKSLIERVENGTWTEEDKLALDDIGIFLDSNSTNKNSSTNQSTSRLTEKEVRDNIDPNTHSIAGLKVTTNPDESYNLVDVDGDQVFGGSRVYINDEVLRDKHQFDPLKGWFWFDGKLIPKSVAEDDNSVFYRNLDQWINSNKNNIYGTNGIDVWGNSSNPFTSYNDSFFLPGLRNNNRGMMFRTLKDPNDPNSVVYEYYDKDSARDRYGFVTPEAVKRLKYNINTGESEELDPLSGVSINYEDITNPVTKWSERAKGYYEINIPGSNGTTAATIFRNPYDVNDVWFYRDGMEQPYQMTPEEVQSLINSGALSANPENHTFTGALSRKWQEILSQNTQNFRGNTLGGVIIDSSLLPISTLIRSLYTTRTPMVNGERWDRASRNIFDNKPKFQSGGRINAAKVSNIENDTTAKTITERTDKDVAKTSLKNGDWKDLTKADKMQIASIAGDLASLIAAIPTGGNPVAGALGYGSTLAQFGADVSRDGFDLGDLGNLALGLGLDTISLLPGVGIGGKMAKMSKTVKKSASLLKNILLASGATSAVSAVNNIVSGKGTLDDWKSLSTGLFAVKGIKNEVQNIRSTQYKGKSPKLEAKTKESLKREYIDKVVADKELGFVDGQPARWANSDGTVKNYKQAIEDLTKSGHLKISKAQEAKWTAEAAKSKTNSTISNIFSGSWNPMSRNYRFRMSNRQLPDDFDIRSLAGHTSKLRTLGRVIRRNPEIASQLQSNGWVLPSTLQFNSRYGGDWFYRNPVFKRFIKFKAPSTLMLPESTGVRDIPVTLSGIKNPIEIRSIDPYLQQVDDYIGLRFHKKGGKIIKAQGGSNSNWFLDKNGKPINEHSESVIVTAKPIDVFSTPRLHSDFLGVKPLNDIDPKLRESIDKYTKQSTGINTNNIKKSSSSMFGSSRNLKWSGINPDMLLGIGDFIASTRGINRTTQKMKDAIRKGMIGSQQQMPTEFYSRFSDNGLHRMYDDRVKEMRKYKTVTSDPNQVMAERLMRDAGVDQIKGERDTKFSQMIDQYNDKLLAQKQQYANIRNQISNENRNRWYQGLAQLDMADANKIGQQTQNVKNLIYQFRQDYAKDLQNRTDIEDKLNSINTETKYQNDLKQLFESFGGFNSMTAGEKEQWGNDWLGYISYKYPDQVSNIRSKAFFDIYQDQANDPKRRHSWIRWFDDLNIPRYVNQVSPKLSDSKYFRYKRGGTIQRFRETNEQAFLDQQKAINKAVNDLNNNIIRLFIKMMS